jgi:hypothetical protein
VILHTALDMTAVLRKLASEGWDITSAGLAALSPYFTERIKRFGEYAHRRPHHPARRFRRAPGPPPVHSWPGGHGQRNRLNTTPRT